MTFCNKISLSTFLNEIQNELKSGHFLATLIMSLMVPDICNGENTGKDNYKKWIEKYHKQHSSISENFNADAIYMLRCSVLHSAKSYKNISLRYNSDTNRHLGHIFIVIHDRITEKETATIGLNINEFAEEIIVSTKKFISDTKKDPLLFSIIDYDKIDNQ